HIASSAGAWTALVDGFGGMRERGDQLCVAPALPASVARRAFRALWHGMAVQVEATHVEVTCTLLGGDGEGMSMQGDHEEEPGRAGQPGTRPVQRRAPLLPAPPQPVGRTPRPAGRDPLSVARSAS